MASTAGQISRELFGFDFRRLFATVSPRSPLRSGNATAQAVAGAGLMALFTLPFLLLLSVVFTAPIAVPAVIGVGYLALSQALIAEHHRRAGLITACVLGGLVAWVLLFSIAGEGRLSSAEIAAALVAPLVAAAPAVVRSFTSQREGNPAPASEILRRAALERVECLDAWAPCEQVLLLDSEGAVLAATAAARRRLRLLPEGFEHHVSSLFESDDLTEIYDAVGRLAGTDAERRAGRARWAVEGPELEVRKLNCVGQELNGKLTRCNDGTIAMRIETIPDTDPAQSELKGLARAACVTVTPADRPRQAVCDVGEALSFTLRHAKSKANVKRVTLTASVDANLLVACDRQVGNRILCQLVDCVLSGSEAGSFVKVSGRRVKGVGLLKAESAAGMDAVGIAESDDRLDIASLRDLVDSAGGTLVVDRRDHKIALSVRLDLAVSQGGQVRMSENGNKG
jgi:hypothetical protein